jgi:phosphoribosyl-ATP pyrophosphohydrolase
LLAAKLIEEAGELGEAASASAITHEAADVLYMTMAKLAASGVSLAAVAAELERRGLKISRRAGDAKVVSGTKTTGGNNDAARD